MFKKLLKYDFRAIWKLWLIGAVTAIGVSVLGGLALRVLSDPNIQLPILIQIMCGFWFFITVITISAFLIASQILIYVRFYKHFFSDEGYLTFTLPVKRSTLYISKTVNAMIWSILSYIVFAIAIFIIFAIVSTSSMGSDFNKVLAELSSIFKGAQLGEVLVMLIFVVEFILIMIAATWFNVSLTHFCITVGATITRKHKVLAAIGIYYAVNAAVGFISQIISFIITMLFASTLPSIENIDPAIITVLVFTIPLLVAAAFAGIAFAFDAMTLKRIKYKLNMA
jgi:hypothetical protein